MSTYKYTNFPVISLNAGISGVLDAISLSIIKRFPPGFFSRIDVKDKNRMRDVFRPYTKNYNTGDDQQLATERRGFPHFMVGYTFSDFKGPGVFEKRNLADYPGAHLSPNFNGYGRIFGDPYGINIFSVDTPIRVNMSFKIVTASYDDQLSIMSYLYNALPWIEGIEFNGIKTEFILPNILVNSVKRLIFKDAPYEAVTPHMIDHFMRFSGGDIAPIYKNGKKENIYMKTKREYESIYFRTTDEPVMGDGEKINRVYSSFDVTFDAWCDINIPLAWVLATPDFVAGTTVGDYLMTHPESQSAEGEHQAIRLRSFHDRVEVPFVIDSNFEAIYEEEFFMAGIRDTVELADFVPETHREFFLQHEGVSWRKNFTFHFFEGPFLVDAMYIKELAPGKLLEFRNCAVTKPYTVKIYVRKDAYANYLKEKA